MNNSSFKIEIYECVHNSGLGKSHLLKKKKNKNNNDIMLFYCEGNNCHFVICDSVNGVKEKCSFGGTEYYVTIEAALRAFKNA